jgi:hypothetical protein
MKTIGTASKELVNQTKQKQQSCGELTDQKPQALTLKESPEAKKQLAVALSMFYDTLKIYGKTPDQMESVTRMFNFVLADYSYEQIQTALAYYAKHNNEMPAPADIATIIERGGKPPFDKAVYVAISKTDPAHRTSEEWAYMRDYERFMVSGGY